jgi:hypothetical protein
MVLLCLASRYSTGSNKDRNMNVLDKLSGAVPMRIQVGLGSCPQAQNRWPDELTDKDNLLPRHGVPDARSRTRILPSSIHSVAWSYGTKGAGLQQGL